MKNLNQIKIINDLPFYILTAILKKQIEVYEQARQSGKLNDIKENEQCIREIISLSNACMTKAILMFKKTTPDQLAKDIQVGRAALKNLGFKN